MLQSDVQAYSREKRGLFDASGKYFDLLLLTQNHFIHIDFCEVQQIITLFR